MGAYTTVVKILFYLIPVFMNFGAVVSNDAATSLLREMKAECSKDGINVKLWFKQPFSGVAYSFGHYDKENCRYIGGGDEDQEQARRKVLQQSSTTNFSFLIPANDCGTEYHETSSNSTTTDTTTTSPQHFKRQRNWNPEQENDVYIENTLLIQNDPTIQEAGDLAQRLRCVWRKEILRPLVASFPFGNVNKRIPDPLRLNGGVKSESVSYSGQSGGKEGGRMRFQSKGQVQSVPYNSYRRKSSRSLPITEAERQRDELLLHEERKSFELSDTAAAAQRLQRDDHSKNTANGKQEPMILVFMTPMIFMALQLQ